jgi:hypothetical protein
MMLDGGKRFLGKCLQVCIIASCRIPVKKLHGCLVAIDLLFGIRFIEVLSRGTVKIIDQLLMLGQQRISGEIERLT